MPSITDNWAEAEELLDSIEPLDQSVGQKLEQARDRGLQKWLRNFVGFFRGSADASMDEEIHALHFQIELSRSFIQLRREARQKLLPKPIWPPDAHSPQLMEEEPNYVVNGLLQLLREIIDDVHMPPHAKDDIVVDFWNKWAFVTWERAVLEDDPKERAEWLGFVDRYLRLINQDPKRATWTPGQVNQVRFQLASLLTPPADPANLKAAQNMLGSILGLPTAAPVAVVALAQDVTQIADAIAKMAQIPDAIAIASNLRRAYPGLTQDSIQKIIALLAGKIPPALLDQIFRQYSSCT